MMENPRKRPPINTITNEIKRLRVGEVISATYKEQAFSDSWSDDESVDFTSKPQRPNYAEKMSVA